jgi:hypothetical protein
MIKKESTKSTLASAKVGSPREKWKANALTYALLSSNFSLNGADDPFA